MKRLVIDTETTGLSPNFNKTLTVGLLLVDVEKDFLDILDQNHIFIKHDHYNTTSEAMKVNKIDIDQHNKIAIPPPKACSAINTFIDNNNAHEIPLLGHNLHFDRGFLRALFDQADALPKLHHQHEDTMYLWRNLQRAGDIPSHLRANLQTLADFFKIDYTKAHDALADCNITAKVYHEMIKLN
jgi:DNA polymerase III alpha subunit (gram-positive type)